MNIRNFLQLQCAFKKDGIIKTTTQHESIFGFQKASGNVMHLFFSVQYLLNGIRSLHQCINKSFFLFFIECTSHNSHTAD